LQIKYDFADLFVGGFSKLVFGFGSFDRLSLDRFEQFKLSFLEAWMGEDLLTGDIFSFMEIVHIELSYK